MIKRKLVPENRRLAFLPKHCGRFFGLCEMAVYSMAGQLCDDYDGGYWHYYDLSNGGWYMGLDSDATYHVIWPGNFFDGEMSADAFSITANLYAFSAMFDSPEENELFVHAYHALRNYAAEHAERELILAAIAEFRMANAMQVASP